MKTNNKTFLILLTLLLCGCGNSTYQLYKITDPVSGKVYYTKEYNYYYSSINFYDVDTDKHVTLSNYEIVEDGRIDSKGNRVP